jgi:P4 family phage/plasmid primase-like protien
MQPMPRPPHGVVGMSDLYIPEIGSDTDTLTAALAYADAGWYVLPVAREDPANPGKNPGSVVGKGWHSKSSRDPQQLAAWFAGTDHGIALHAGRSGAVAFDVDHPDKLPEILLGHLDTAPYQSSRPEHPGRGHYVFTRPPGRTIGNSSGHLGDTWGEVRGLNGVIIAEPSWHPESGEYKWIRTGPVPLLPDEIAEQLDNASPAQDAATDAAVAEFLNNHTTAARPEILRGRINGLAAKIESGASVHKSTVPFLTGALEEARAGYYTARQAVDALKQIFIIAVALGGSSGRRREGAVAESEWDGILAWAVAQANAADLDEVHTRVREKMPDNVDQVDNIGASESGETGQRDDNIGAFKFPDGQRPTDVGNANRLLRHGGGRIRYVHAWGKWIVYQDGRWIIDEKDALVTEMAKQVPKGLYRLAAKTAATDGADAAKDIWDWALKSDTSGHIAAMIRLARGVSGLLVNHEDLDADHWLLNVTNGTIDLRTGQLREHDPADLCTLQAPVAYDEHAVAPLWEKCLQRWQPDPEVRDYIQARAGAGATGIPTETVDIDYGHGGNGKSKFHGAVQHVLGPYTTVPHKSLLIAGRFEQHPTVVADLFRKRLAVASETKAAENLNDEQVKNLTGGDRLSGRRMREDPWGFWPTHTLVMFSNHKPAVQGRDEGIWRRLRLVPWTITIPEDERDEGLALKLQAEAPGILKWIIDGARRFHAAGGLRPPEVIRVATADYRQGEDIVGRFVHEVLEFAPHTFCYSSDIKAELDAWCAENDIASPPRMNEITAKLLEKGASNGGRRKIHGKRSTIWRGVCVAQTGGETP